MTRSPAEESEDPRLSLALALAGEAARLAVAGRPDAASNIAVRVPVAAELDVAGYRGAPVPFLAGNPLAHATAVASCRALVPVVERREG